MEEQRAEEQEQDTNIFGMPSPQKSQELQSLSKGNSPKAFRQLDEQKLLASKEPDADIQNIHHSFGANAFHQASASKGSRLSSAFNSRHYASGSSPHRELPNKASTPIMFPNKKPRPEANAKNKPLESLKQEESQTS